MELDEWKSQTRARTGRLDAILKPSSSTYACSAFILAQHEMESLQAVGDEAARELKNEENSSWVAKQLKKALDPMDRDTVEVWKLGIP